jgi:hypothetical protein
MKTMYNPLLKRAAASLCCVAAVYSFLSSGFYGVLSQWLAMSFATERIPLFLGLDLGSFMRLGLLAIIGVYVVSLISSDEATPGETLLFSLLLYMPEALSLSEVNWLNAVGLSSLSTPARPPWAVLATGLVIMGAYLLHAALRNLTCSSARYRELGFEVVEVEDAFSRQLRPVLLNCLLSIAAILGIDSVTSAVSPNVDVLLNWLPVKHLISGILAVGLVLFLLIYFTSDLSKDA